MDKTAVSSPEAPVASGGYAQAIVVSGVKKQVFVSGQIPVDADGRVPTGFVEQARLTWRNLAAQLEAADMSLDHLVKVTIFLSDRRHATENRQVRQEVLGARDVALTVVITGIFDEAWLLEIEAIAAS